MDYLKLKLAIQTTPECFPYIITNTMPIDPEYYYKDQMIANIFNATSGTQLVDRYENATGLMSALGTSTAATILEKLEQAKATIPVLKWAMYSIVSSEGINIGDPETQAMIDELVAGDVLTNIEGEAIKNLAIRPSSLAHQTVGQPITPADVSIALRNF
jgi:hypothetical protein